MSACTAHCQKWFWIQLYLFHQTGIVVQCSVIHCCTFGSDIWHGAMVVHFCIHFCIILFTSMYILKSYFINIQLEGTMKAVGNVESWLGELLNAQQRSLHAVIRAASITICDSDFKLLPFLKESIAQVSICTSFWLILNDVMILLA